MINARDGRPASCRSSSSATARGSSSAGCSSRSRAGNRPTTRRGSSRRSASRRPGLPVERYDLGPGHVYVELVSADDVAARRARPGRARARDRRRRQLLRARRRGLEDAHVRAVARRRRGSRDRLGGRAARAPPRPARAHRVRRADRDHAGRRDRPARRSSTRVSTARPSAIERVTVGGAAVIVARGEFSFLISTASISGSSTASDDPERAAVAREVEPVARRVDDDVGVVLDDRDRAAGRQPAARLAPRRARVVRDERAAASRRRRRRPSSRPRPRRRARQVERERRRRRELACRTARPRPSRGRPRTSPRRWRRPRSSRDSSDATTAVARRAAPAGAKPALRATTYDVANASPAPVGSPSIGRAGIVLARAADVHRRARASRS